MEGEVGGCVLASPIKLGLATLSSVGESTVSSKQKASGREALGRLAWEAWLGGATTRG